MLYGVQERERSSAGSTAYMGEERGNGTIPQCCPELSSNEVQSLRQPTVCTYLSRDSDVSTR